MAVNALQMSRQINGLWRLILGPTLPEVDQLIDQRARSVHLTTYVVS